MPPNNTGGMRAAAGFVASGAAAMLAWSPPAGAVHVNPLADTMSLVRLLGGLGAEDFPPGADVRSGDVVNRSAVTGPAQFAGTLYSPASTRTCSTASRPS